MIAGVGLVIFVIALWFVVHRIVDPIRQMTKASEDLTAGILEIELDVHTGDELEKLATAFKSVAAALEEKTSVALKIAAGDLTTWVPLASEHDTLGKALINMRYGFFDSLKDLKSLAESVGREGDNLTQTNERLVTNTSESAAQLKDVAASLDELNTQTKKNSESSQQAESLALKAKNGSSEGLSKMHRMVSSMDSITKSSEEINKIIKVIDDIAFQTNLLALNAAVEAARAGTHGKGFAVVAEEVRNLAARSAKAARETADLIQESIRQVEQGSDAAKETSESLNTITSQVEEVSKIITQISRDSDDQTQRIGQVNSSVSSLSTTADQNTVTVSEAADAVTSISTTAHKLDVITQHFKANDGGKVTPPPGKEPGFIHEEA
jgi:methyl-accepting chemotaxis protein